MAIPTDSSVCAADPTFYTDTVLPIMRGGSTQCLTATSINPVLNLTPGVLTDLVMQVHLRATSLHW
jgi:hypothetical protein